MLAGYIRGDLGIVKMVCEEASRGIEDNSAGPHQVGIMNDLSTE